jgi:murein DD-endopeptidase MepM/ murein hydrolase activator NlpD
VSRKASNRKVPAREGSRRTLGSAKRSSGGLLAPLVGARNARSSGTRKPSRRRTAPPTKEEIQERKLRNRIVLAMFCIVGLNAYVFLGRDELEKVRATSVALRADVRSVFATPPLVACTDHPVRIFAGLAHQLFLEHRLSNGRSLRLAMLDLGIDPLEIDRLEQALRPTFDPALLGGSGSMLRLATDHDGKVQAMEVELGQGHVIQACRTGEGFRARNLELALTTKLESISLLVDESQGLSAALELAGEEPELGSRLAEVLGSRVDLSVDLRPGDRFSILVEKRYLAGNFHRYGHLLVVDFRGNAGSIEAYYHAGSQGELYYQADATPVASSWLRTPIAYYPTSENAESLAAKTEFVGGTIGGHYGRPFAAPVVALADATLVDLGEDERRGRWLEFQNKAGFTYRYWHLARTVGSLAPGAKVEQGQLVGLVGRSGATPTSRLRLEIVDENGAAVDPVALERGEIGKNEEDAGLEPASLEEFQRNVKNWKRQMKGDFKAAAKRRS